MTNSFNFSNTTPAAPSGSTNVSWQVDGSTPNNISASLVLPSTTVTSVTPGTGISASITAGVLSVGVSGAIPIANGGTNGATAAAGLYNLGGASLSAANTLAGNQAITGSLTTNGALNVVGGATLNSGLNLNNQALTGVANLGGAVNVTGVLTANGATNLNALVTTSGNVVVGAKLGVGSGTPRNEVSIGANLDLFCTNSVNLASVQSIRADNIGNLILNAFGTSASVYLNWDTTSGTGGVIFGNGAQGNMANVSNAGLGTFAGLSSSAAVSGSFGGWILWTPALVPATGMTMSTPTSVTAKYIRIGPMVTFRLTFTTTIGGTLSNYFNINGIPVPEVSSIDSACVAIQTNNGPMSAKINGYTITSTGYVNFAAGSTTISLSGSYQCA
jgi:hypothetical protein